MKTGIKVILIFFILILLIIGTVMFCFSYGKFTKEKQVEKEAKAAYYKELADRETEWVLSLQLNNGALLLYQPEKDEGYVNPYFACETMLGVISDKEPEHVEAAGRYLHWHTNALLNENGIISDYELTDKGLISKDESDSFDSYAAGYLLLLAEYIDSGGDLDAIGDWKEAVKVLWERFEDVTKNDVTYVNDNCKIAYLMDNSEVWIAFERFGDVIADRKDFKDDEELCELAENYLYNAGKIRDSIENKYWMEEQEVYTIALLKDGEMYGEPDPEVFYPDAIAQIYPAIMGVRKVEDREMNLYQKICDAHDWEHGNIEGASFNWTVMAYAALVHYDESRMDTYLDTYESIVKESRKYPFHTSNAGWIIRVCNKRADMIMAEENTGFTNYIKWLIGEDK